MQKTKTDGEIIAEIYRNARLALTSIADILPETDDEEMRQEILSEHEEYERICAEAALLAKNMGAEVKEPSPVKKGDDVVGYKAEHRRRRFALEHCADDGARHGDGHHLAADDADRKQTRDRRRRRSALAPTHRRRGAL